MPEFLIASLMVAVRQASRAFRHWSGALALNDHLIQRSCARSHWGMSTSPTSARAGDKKATKGAIRISRIPDTNASRAAPGVLGPMLGRDVHAKGAS